MIFCFNLFPISKYFNNKKSLHFQYSAQQGTHIHRHFITYVSHKISFVSSELFFTYLPALSRTAIIKEATKHEKTEDFEENIFESASSQVLDALLKNVMQMQKQKTMKDGLH